MLSPVPPPDAISRGRVLPQKECRRDQKQGRKARGKEICRVVQLRRNTAEVEVALVFVAHHTVHGVDGLIAQGKRRAAEHHPEKRGDHPVGEILRHGLHRRAGDPLGAEAFGIAPDDAGDGPAGSVQALMLQGVLYAHGLVPQVLDGEGLPAPDDLQRKGQGRRQAVQGAQDKFT